MSSFSGEKERRIAQFTQRLKLMALRRHKLAKGNCFIIFDDVPPHDDDTERIEAFVGITADCLANGGSSSAHVDLADEKLGGGADDPSRYMQFAFMRDCFYLELPNNAVYPNEAEQIFRCRRGFFRARNRTDLWWVRANLKDMVKWDPIQKVYLYHDEESAAEDMAFIAYQIWNFPIDRAWYVKAASFDTGHCFEWGKRLD